MIFRIRGHNRVGHLLWAAHHRWPCVLTWLPYWAWHRWVLRYFWYEPEHDRWSRW